MQDLVIVESPTKARTLSRFLGDKYRIEASMGHVRDLPKSELGIDEKNNFTPHYIIPRDKKKRVNELKKLAQGAKTLWLATDPDREGEAIAWHISELLGNSEGRNQIHRVVFHEITQDAVKEAFEHPRDLDLKLIDAQQARRVLDRLVGYKLSPLLWKKVKRGLSAGRVQSVALRLIVEREDEIKAFKPVEYWSIEALLESLQTQSLAHARQPTRLRSNKAGLRVSIAPSLQSGELSESDPSHSNLIPGDDQFIAILIELNGKKLEISNETEAKKHLEVLEKAEYQVEKVHKKQSKRTPPPPFTTSTLQQTAGNRLGFSAKKTMSLAQFLYEHGLITYMRTDSVFISSIALKQAQEVITNLFGKNYLPKTPRLFKQKSKLAQEAHEAIRPTDVRVKAEGLRDKERITRDHIRLYDLIWKRMMASQMNEAVLDHTSIDVRAAAYLLRATGAIILFDGWLKLYRVKGKGEKGKEEGSEEDHDEDKILPDVHEGEDLKLLELKPEQHFTQAPPRYSEASLIKHLEELGIGRPSTYAPILSTILERYYVERVERRFSPTVLGIAVNSFLMKNFPEILDYQFTASMEEKLDDIAHGQRLWQPTIKEFYDPFEKKVENTQEHAEHVKIETEKVDKDCPECGKSLIVRFGRFGKFLACSGFPDCKHTEPLEEKINAKCPKDGGDIVKRRTKKGRPFYGCSNYPKCDFASWTKPKEQGDKVQVTGDSLQGAESS